MFAWFRRAPVAITNSTKRRCCLCGKIHSQCSAFTLARDIDWEVIPRETCQGCSEVNIVLWFGEIDFWPRIGSPLWVAWCLHWFLRAIGQDPTKFLIGRKREA